MKVVVIGSSNIDMVAQVSHLPAPGETVGDANFMQSLGGKGANQAVAAARLGGFASEGLHEICISDCFAGCREMADLCNHVDV